MQEMFSVKNGFPIIQGVSGGIYHTPENVLWVNLRPYNQAYLYLKLNFQDVTTQKKVVFLQFYLL